jgi:transposase
VVDYQQLYEQSEVVNKQQSAIIEDLRSENVMIRHELAQLRKMIFNRHQERFPPVDQNPAQLSLSMQTDEVQATSLTAAQKISYTRKGTQEVKPSAPAVRMKLPEHLDRVVVVLEPAEKKEGAKRIDTEVTEELDYHPGHFFVRRYERVKYVQEGTVIMADLPSRPLPKAIAGAGLLAQIVIDKFVDHRVL